MRPLFSYVAQSSSSALRALSGFTVSPASESGDKITRLGPFSAQCRAGNVKILRGAWNEKLFRVLEGFPDLAHDDEVALEMLNPQIKVGVFTSSIGNKPSSCGPKRRGVNATGQGSKPCPLSPEPEVRIHLPPAASLVRTCGGLVCRRATWRSSSPSAG